MTPGAVPSENVESGFHTRANKWRCLGRTSSFPAALAEHGSTTLRITARGGAGPISSFHRQIVAGSVGIGIVIWRASDASVKTSRVFMPNFLSVHRHHLFGPTMASSLAHPALPRVPRNLDICTGLILLIFTVALPP